jgi:hypothetical protein
MFYRSIFRKAKNLIFLRILVPHRLWQWHRQKNSSFILRLKNVSGLVAQILLFFGVFQQELLKRIMLALERQIWLILSYVIAVYGAILPYKEDCELAVSALEQGNAATSSDLLQFEATSTELAIYMHLG